MKNRIKEIDKFLNDYIFKFPDYILNSMDKKEVDFDQAKWLVNKIYRKKFRKSKIDKNNFNDIYTKINHSIQENQPIHFSILFGGYKHFWNKSAPLVDWSELFNLRFMSEFVAPILATYKKGVVLDYASADVILTMMDNIPKEDLNTYAESFEKLIEEFSQIIPNNFKINYVRTGKKYDNNYLYNEINKKLPKSFDEWKKLTKKEQNKNIHRSKRSIMWNGEENLSRLNNDEKYSRIVKSRLIEQIFYEVEDELIGEYYYGKNNIPLVLSWGLSDENIDHWLTLGSTFASSTDFWIGRGILECRKNKFIPRIVSKNQYLKIEKSLDEMKTCKMHKFGNNFSKIELFEGRLNF
jgi:hypothetical protein